MVWQFGSLGGKCEKLKILHVKILGELRDRWRNCATGIMKKKVLTGKIPGD